MVRATRAQQMALIELQKTDTAAAKLSHERSTLPVLSQLADLEAHRVTLDARRVELATRLSDERRSVASIEGDVELAAARVTRQEQRVASGASAREAVALQEELAHLATRIATLEEEQIAAMEVVEDLDRDLAGVQRALEELGERRAVAEKERDVEYVRLDGELATLAERRAEIAQSIPEPVLETYERVREDKGGLAVLSLHGQRTEPVAIGFSASELADFRSAPEDELTISEEYGYIVVRVDA